MAALRIKPAPALPVINLANGGGTIPGMGREILGKPGHGTGTPTVLTSTSHGGSVFS
jgi:hypothetical protein